LTASTVESSEVFDKAATDGERHRSLMLSLSDLDTHRQSQNYINDNRQV